MTTPRKVCGWCRKPTRGEGIIDGQPYCHDGATPTCYMRACWARTDAGYYPKRRTMTTPRRPDQHDQEARS